MPGRQKRSRDDKDVTDEADIGASQPPASGQSSKASSTDQDKALPQTSQTSQISSNSEITNLSPCSDFTRALRDALRDPEVRQGFADILWPKITSYVDSTIKPVQDKLEDLDLDVENLKEEVANLKMNQHSKDSALHSRVMELERQVRSNMLRVSGLEPSPLPPDSDSQPTLHDRYSLAMISLAEEAGISGLKVDDFMEFNKINIPSVTGASSVVSIKFFSVDKRNMLYKQRKLFKNCKNKVFLNEELTRQDALAFKKARRQVKEGLLSACWTSRGCVWGKTGPESKPFPIKD